MSDYNCPDCRMIIREIAEDVTVSTDSYCVVFSGDLSMKSVARKPGPKLVNSNQKNCCMSIAQKLSNYNDPVT